uniref:Uncharacterized protein n=1 Tax=Arundo donax TaxID=35708 RepID=A0A0A8Y3P0_ARUDO
MTRSLPAEKIYYVLNQYCKLLLIDLEACIATHSALHDTLPSQFQPPYLLHQHCHPLWHDLPLSSLLEKAAHPHWIYMTLLMTLYQDGKEDVSLPEDDAHPSY